MPKPTLKRANSRFAEIARKTGGVFVFATRDATLPNRKSVSAEIAGYQYANHQCNKCTATFAFPKTNGAQPFCVVCGDGDVDVQEDVKPIIAPDEELSYLTCAGCGTINTFHSALAGMGNHIHCSACGTDMVKADADTEDQDQDDAEDETEEDDTDFRLDDDQDADSETSDVDDMELLDLEDDLPEEDEEGLESANTTNEDNVGGKPDGKPLKADPKAPNAPAIADADEMPNNDYRKESMEMNLVDLDDEDTAIEAISFFYGENKVLLSAKDQIIATLVEADAGSYAGMLQTEQFRMSVAHTIETEGLKAAIATYKFKPARVTVRIAKVVQAKVDAALKTQRTQATAGADTYAEQFQHSLDIAAAGYAGNFWRNKHDPLKTALIAELTSLNIRKPEKLIDKIFATYSVAQFREVIEVARDLSKKPVEALNALAETIDLVKYTPTTAKNKQVAGFGDDTSDTDADADDVDGDDEDEDDVQDEFATATPIDAVTASVKHSSYKTPELRNILGASNSFFQHN